jgi:hypothetical protein
MAFLLVCSWPAQAAPIGSVEARIGGAWNVPLPLVIYQRGE